MKLSNAVAEVESSDTPHAIRFEEKLYLNKPVWIISQISNILRKNPLVSRDTANMIACTSWGKYQLLGANIYAQGFRGDAISFLIDDTAQDQMFSLFIETHEFGISEDILGWSEERFLQFATFYNGPSNPELYVKSLKLTLE